MFNDSGRDNFRPERVPHPLLAVIVCTALTGVVQTITPSSGWGTRSGRKLSRPESLNM